MLIRQATRDDMPALRALYDEFHAFHVRGVPSCLRVPGAGEVDRADFERSVERILTSEEATLLVTDFGDRIVGLAEAYLDALSDSPFVVPRRTATLQSLFVTEEVRGTGVGSALVEAVEQWARSHGAEEMRTKTWEFPEGPLAFYERGGYRTIRRELAKLLAADGH